MPARAAGRSEASRDTSSAVRAWLLRPDQEYYELVYLVRYRYRGTGTSQLSVAAQRM